MELNRHELFVELDHHIYAPGDLVKGCVKMDLPDRVECDSVSAHFSGHLRTTVVASKPAGSIDGVVYRLERELLNHRILLQRLEAAAKPPHDLLDDEIDAAFADLRLQRPKGPLAPFCGLPAGRRSFPFEFRLPASGLQTSFAARHCNTTIKYEAFVQLHFRSQLVKQAKLDFAIVVPAPIPRTPAAPATASSNLVVSRNCQIQILLTVNRKFYLPTERVDATISISNGWKHSLKFIHFNVYQRMTSVAFLNNCPSIAKTFVSSIQHAGVGLPRPMVKIAPGSSYSFAPDFYIPALIPIQEVEKIFRVDYFAQVQVGRDANTILGKCRVPIIIGTHYADEDGTPTHLETSTSTQRPTTALCGSVTSTTNAGESGMREEMLVDLSTPPCSPPPAPTPTHMQFSATNPFVNHDRFATTGFV